MKTRSDQVFDKNTLLLQKAKENCKEFPSPVLKSSPYEIKIQSANTNKSFISLRRISLQVKMPPSVLQATID